jgi:hypothetical protein
LPICGRARVSARLQRGSGNENRFPKAYRFRAVLRAVERFVAVRLRVAAAFFAERERAAGGRLAEALPPIRPPFFAETLVSGTPRPEPLLLPPPVSLLTVAQARC